MTEKDQQTLNNVLNYYRDAGLSDGESLANNFIVSYKLIMEFIRNVPDNEVNHFMFAIRRHYNDMMDQCLVNYNTKFAEKVLK